MARIPEIPPLAGGVDCATTNEFITYQDKLWLFLTVICHRSEADMSSMKLGVAHRRMQCFFEILNGMMEKLGDRPNMKTIKKALNTFKARDFPEHWGYDAK